MGAPSSVSPRLGRASAHGRPDAAPGNMLRLVLCAPEPARSDPRASLRRAGPVFRPMKNPQNIPEEAIFQATVDVLLAPEPRVAQGIAGAKARPERALEHGAE